MTTLVERLEARLLEPPATHTTDHALPDLDPLSADIASERGAHRLLRLLNDTPGRADLAVLMRQVIRSYKRRLPVARGWWEHMGEAAEPAGLRVVDHGSGHFVEILADPWDPPWLPRAQGIDWTERRRCDTPGLGSGALYAMTGFSSYQSQAQKAAVEACLFAAPGSTTLVTMPTGSGKSLCALLPAWQDSEGGTRRAGTTLVIVPTVSLALDQERGARRFFPNASGEGHMPHARVGSSTDQQRELVRKGIRDGSLPILYTSPEALLRSELYDVCLQAARDGLLHRLVIDEAHIVASWGAGFRTEFQFLAAYRKELLEASHGRLRTTLLSATIPEQCAALLQHLFGSEGKFGIVQANRLRPEPAFWFSEAPNEQVRQDRIMDALYHLPRPAILYLTRPMHADQWVQRLRQSGFARVEAFTGETPDGERDRLVRAWDGDAVDLMVATAAFGLGVDKPDVRTVLHACLPENLDRYYQEVGRGGRDGYSSISLVCITPDDADLAVALTNPPIKTENALQRWKAMRRSGVFEGGQAATVNIDAVPDDRPDIRSTRWNREWNEHVLLLLQRAGLIRIEETRVDAEQSLQPHGNQYIDSVTPMRISFQKSADILGDPVQLEAATSSFREQESVENQLALTKLRDIIRDYAPGGSAHRCLAEPLSRLYPDTARACGGCGVCRRIGRKPYANTLQPTIAIPLPSPSAEYLSGDLRHRMLGGRALNIVRHEDNTVESLKARHLLFVRLVRAGVQQLVLPEALCEDGEWMRHLIIELADSDTPPHLILPETYLAAATRYPLYPVPTAIVYPPDDEAADQIYTRFRANYPTLAGGTTPIIHIVPHASFLPSLGGFFISKVNGLQEDADQMANLLQEAEDYSPF